MPNRLARTFSSIGPIWRVLGYGAALGLLTLLLVVLEANRATQAFLTEFFVLVIAVIFTAVGIWAGAALTRPAKRPKITPQTTEQAKRNSGLTPREYEVLTELAQGHSNKQIARGLGVSPHTIKTQTSSLYAKLDASNRTQAVTKARRLGLLT